MSSFINSQTEMFLKWLSSKNNPRNISPCKTKTRTTTKKRSPKDN